MKKLLTILLLASFTFTFTGCDEYLDVNNNEDAPDYVSEDLYLAGILSSYMSIYFDIRALGPLTQMMGTSGFTTMANHSYYGSSDSSGEIWKLVYWQQGYNLENMINQSLENESYRLAGIGYAIKAFSWDLLTKYHGEAPLKQAYEPGRLAHDYDYQPEIYTQVREWANKAIEYLEMEDNTNYGNKLKENDLVYGGDASKWIKFAHSVIVRNLASLTNKNDFKESYAQELISHAALAMQTTDDDATVTVWGGGADATYSAYNNFWGVHRANLSNTYWQHDYAVQVMTGTVPAYNEQTGDKILPENITEYRPFALNPKQIITDTLVNEKGHFDPRMVAKLATASDPYYKHVKDIDSIKAFKYIGSSFTSNAGPTGTAPNYYGRVAVVADVAYDGSGRWLYRNDAPYVLMNAAEIKFCLAEAYWKLGQKGEARTAWEEGVALDLQFTAKYLKPGSYAGTDVTGGALPGGDHITKDLFDAAAAEYLAGPFVKALPDAEFSLSHIMMQKWVALYPWGAPEAWVDMRKYHYDIDYTGEYPSKGNGWEATYLNQKWDSDPDKVYKGLYLAPAQVQNRKSSYGNDNQGSPAYRVRPRYNSEYMWNKPSLNALTPIKGTAANYHTSIPWFAYPGEYPASL